MSNHPQIVSRCTIVISCIGEVCTTDPSFTPKSQWRLLHLVAKELLNPAYQGQVNCRLPPALRRDPFCPLTVFTVPEAGDGNRPK